LTDKHGCVGTPFPPEKAMKEKSSFGSREIE
jgi:hypothetical protein